MMFPIPLRDLRAGFRKRVARAKRSASIMTARKKNGPSLEQLLDYMTDPRYTISDMEFYSVALPAADDEDPDNFIDRLPEYLRPGFERVVFDYPLPGEGKGISFGATDPKDETVVGLRRAFERRRSG
jgi:hypothetical protein